MKKDDKVKTKSNKEKKTSDKKSIFTKKVSKKNKLEKNENSNFSLLEVFIVMFISIFIGFIFGWIMFSKGFKIGKNDSYINEIVNVYNNINENYMGKVNKDELVNSAVNGMINSIDDPYSLYMDNEETIDFNQTLYGEYVGLGITITMNEKDCVIVDVLKNSPSEEKGIKKDDIITKINNKDITNKSMDEISKLLGNKKEEKVKLTVLRDKKEIDYSIVKETIVIESVSSEFYGDKNDIGYIKIDNFAANTSKQFANHLNNLINKNVYSLIIDVRFNSGGMLTQVNEILEMFLDKKTVMYKIKDRKNTRNIVARKSSKINIPIIVLVNEGSASASEILASSLSNNYKNCTIVGTNTYGKGTIQKSSKLSNGSTLKFTIEKWLDSKGKYYGDCGIKPEVFVEQSDKYFITREFNDDLQLKKAIEELKK